MIKRLPWLRRRKRTDPEVPLRLPVACRPNSARTRLIWKLVNDKAEDISRREGVDRREFMASACGMATTLYMINLVNGCSSPDDADNRLGTGGRDAGRDGGGGSGGRGSSMSAGRDGGVDSGKHVDGRDGGGSGGYSGMTDAAMRDAEAATCALGDGGNELIIDMQTHLTVDGSLLPNILGGPVDIGTFGITKDRYPWLERTPGCSESDFTCFNQKAYVDQIFLNSETTIAVLAPTPYAIGADGTGTGGFSALSNEDLLVAAMELGAAFPKRILTQCAVMPNDRSDLQFTMMEKNANRFDNWTTSPPWSTDFEGGYWLDQDVGAKMIQKGLDLNMPIFTVHKGMPGSSYSGLNPMFTNPKDVGPAARMFANAFLVIRHAAFEHGFALGESSFASLDDPKADVGWGPGVGQWPEGPYDVSLESLGDMQPTKKGTFPLNRGVNSLIKSLRDAGIGPNGTSLDGMTVPMTHVYAECGSAWPNLMLGRVEEAMHFWGKLLKHVGEDRILWATDCLWYGSPQPIIQAFRAFEISREFQDKFGYPALTRARKEKILGQNAARLQNIRHNRIGHIEGCHSDFVNGGDALLELKRELDEELGPRREMMFDLPGPRTRRELLRRAIAFTRSRKPT